MSDTDSAAPASVDVFNTTSSAVVLDGGRIIGGFEFGSVEPGDVRGHAAIDAGSLVIPVPDEQPTDAPAVTDPPASVAVPAVDVTDPAVSVTDPAPSVPVDAPSTLPGVTPVDPKADKPARGPKPASTPVVEA